MCWNKQEIWRGNAKEAYWCVKSGSKLDLVDIREFRFWTKLNYKIFDSGP